MFVCVGVVLFGDVKVGEKNDGDAALNVFSGSDDVLGLDVFFIGGVCLFVDVGL